MIITLTTDFGLADPFVGIMKGVILGIAPNVQLVDVSHDIGSYDVFEGAFLIDTSFRYFPPGTIHVVVIDPGVGSARRPIAACNPDHRGSSGHVFIAPDNGVLSYVLDKEAVVHHITNTALFLNSVSHTFHGRDIFAPVAAHLAQGTPIEAVGPRISDFVKIPPPKPRVMRIDKFGNIITSLRRQDLKADFSIRVAGVTITRLRGSFSEAEPGEYFAFEGSTGYIELALNRGSAAERLNVKLGAEIEVEVNRLNQ